MTTADSYITFTDTDRCAKKTPCTKKSGRPIFSGKAQFQHTRLTQCQSKDVKL